MKIKNGYSISKNGWKFMSIKGKPYERGYAYGELSASDFLKIQKMLSFFVLETFGKSWEHMVEEINKDFKKMTEEKFPELYEEMKGIAEGCIKGGCKTSIEEIIAWNFYISIPYWYSIKDNPEIGTREGGSADRCSAFIAVGNDWTENGEIVVAHNSFADYIDAQYSNIVLQVNPEKGNSFIMQTSPCWIWSGTDFFITSKGIIGTETTIGGFFPYEMKFPIGYRIRKAMQYADTLDKYVEILLEENSGDYANSWLFGDINTKEIMRLELGLKYYNVDRTKNGYYIGFNAAFDEKLRVNETKNSGFYDIRRHQGARYVRLSDLMDNYKGKLNIENAKKIIADHYDVYLEKDENPNSRTVCSHYDLDAREFMSQSSRPVPYSPHGAVDGIVCDSKLAKNMQFIGRFGNSCGIAFNSTEFFKKHRQWERFKDYIFDRPTQPWTEFPLNKASYSKKNRKKTKNTANKNITAKKKKN